MKRQRHMLKSVELGLLFAVRLLILHGEKRAAAILEKEIAELKKKSRE